MNTFIRKQHSDGKSEAFSITPQTYLYMYVQKYLSRFFGAFVVMCIVYGALAQMASATTETFNDSVGSPWTVPTNVYSVTIECWGGGGGGGDSNNVPGGSGGGGGGYAKSTLSVTPTDNYSYSVGAAGAAGGNGGNTTFNTSTCTADGGTAGADGGGTPGSGGTSSGTDANYTGGDGGTGSSPGGGGGGSSGGTSSDGTDGVADGSSTASVTGGGDGGASVGNNADGDPGSAPGGGGGGAGEDSSGGPESGAAGAAGRITLTYFTGMTISGSLYSDEGSNKITTTKTIKIRIGTSTPSTHSTTTASGDWTMDIAPDNIAQGTPYVIWVDGGSGIRASVVGKFNGAGPVSDLDLYQNYVIARHEGTGTSTTIIDFDTHDSIDDTDILYTASTTDGSLTLLATSTFYIWPSDTFTSGGLVTLPGSFVASTSATYTTHASGTLFVATSTGFTISGIANIGSTTFNGSGGGWAFAEANATTSNLTIAAGTLTAPAGTLEIRGDYNNSGGVFENNGGKLSLKPYINSGDLKTDWGDSDSGSIYIEVGDGNDLAQDIVHDASGSIYVVGRYYNITNADTDWRIRKYDANGDPDTTWGDSDSGGIDIDDNSDNDDANAVVVDDTGAIIVAGQYRNGASLDWRIRKYDPNGDPDTTWGDSDSGSIDIANSDGHDDLHDVVRDDTGAIYAAGNYYNITNGDTDWRIRKYDANGDLATDWGDSDSGSIDVSLDGSGAGGDDVWAITLDDAGAIYVAGVYYNDTNSDEDWRIRKYDANGDLDTTWGDSDSGNIDITHDGTSSNDDVARDIVVDDTGAIYVAGYYYNNTNADTDWRIRKYDSNGDLATDWGDSDSGNIDISSNDGADSAYALALDHTGAIYVAGSYHNSTNADRDWRIRKYDANGDLATDWGDSDSGSIEVSYDSSSNDSDLLLGMSLAEDGTIYVAGSYGNNVTSDIDWRIQKYSGWSNSINGSMIGTSAFNNVEVNNSESTTLAGNASTSDLTIGNAAKVVAPSGSFTIAGDFTQNGTFDANGGLVTFASTSAQSILGTLSGTSALNDVTFAGTGAKSIISGGNSVALAGDFEVTGDLANDSTVHFGHATTTFTGASAQTISGTTGFVGTSTFNKVKFSGAGEKTFTTNASSTDFTIASDSGTTTLPSGSLTVAGDYANNSTSTHNSGAVTFGRVGADATTTGATQGLADVVASSYNLTVLSPTKAVVSLYDGPGLAQRLYTYQFSETGWSQLGTYTSLPVASNPALTALDSTDIAYIEGTNDQLAVYRFDGSSWSEVGASTTISGVGVNPALTTLNETDVALADSGNDKLAVYRFDGSSWSEVGASTTISGMLSPALAALNATDVAFIDTTNEKLATYRFDGSSWSEVGASTTISGIGTPSLTALNGTDVALIETTGDQLAIYRFNGSSWSEVGTPTTVTDGDRVAAFSATEVALVVDNVASNNLGYYRLSYPTDTTLSSNLTGESALNDVAFVGTSTAIFGANASTSDFTVGTDVTLTAPNELDIAGDYTNNGTVNSANTTYFSGASTQTLSGTMTGTSTFQAVEFSGAGEKTFSANASTTNFTVEATSGTTTFPAGALTIDGPYENLSLIDANGGTLYMNGRSASGTLTGTSALNDVAINPPSDATQWATTTAAGDDDVWLSVTHGKDKFVAVGDTGDDRVMYSTDGITWATTTAAGDNDVWESVTYGNGLFVAVASETDIDDNVMTSPDGINWTARSAAGDDDNWKGIAYGNNVFVAVGEAGGDRAMYSTDGITWATTTAAGDDDDWESVTYGNGLFVAVSDSLSSDSNVMTSPDGINWTARSAADDNDNLLDVTYGNGLFVAVGNIGDRAMYSTDGITWATTTAAGDNDSWQGVAYGNGIFVAVGTGGDHAMVSLDGVEWEVVNNLPGSWTEAIYNRGIFVAVGVSNERVMYSSTGTMSFLNNASTTDLTIAATAGTTTMPSLLSIVGDYTNNSTYPVEFGTGTTTFNGTTLQTATGTLDGTSAFHHVQITNTAGTDAQSAPSIIFGTTASSSGDLTIIDPGVMVQFASGATTTWENINIAGDGGDYVYLYSTDAGTQWHIDVRGTESVDYVTIKDGNACSSTGGDISTTNSIEGTNVTCWTFPGGATYIVVSGNIYSDEGNTLITGGETIKVAVGTTTPSVHTTTSNGSGAWTFTDSIDDTNVSATTTYIVWVDGNASTRAVTVTKASSTNDITGLDLYEDRVIVKHESTATGSAISITDMATYDATDDTDIQYDASSTVGTLTINAGNELHVWQEDTFAPGGTVTLHGNAAADPDGTIHLPATSTFRVGGDVSLAGSLQASSSAEFYNLNSYLITFTATTTGNTISSDLASGPYLGSLNFDGNGGSWTFSDNATTSDFTIATGTVTGPSALTVIGDYTNNDSQSVGDSELYIEADNWNVISQPTAGTIASGDTSGIGIISSSAFVDGTLYVGTWVSNSAEVYRYDGGTSWTKVSSTTPGVIETGGTENIDAVSSMVNYGGTLYIGTRESGSAEVYRYDGGTDWTKISDSTAGTIVSEGTSAVIAIQSMQVAGDELYIGTYKTHQAEVYRYDGGTSWTKVTQTTAGTIASGGTIAIDYIDSMAFVDGALFAGTWESNDAEVYHYDGGTDWTKISDSTAGTIISGESINIDRVDSMIGLNGVLYIGTNDVSNAEVYRYDGGSDWTKVSDATAGTIQSGGTASIAGVGAMEVLNGSLYIGTDDFNTAEIYRYDGGSDWTKVSDATAGTIVSGGTAAINAIYTLTAAEGTLYVPTTETSSSEVYAFNTLHQTISGESLVGTNAFGNVTLSGSSSKAFLSNASTSNLTVDSTSGTTTLPYNLTLTGNYTNNSSLPVYAPTGVLVATSSSAQTFSGTMTGDSRLWNVEFYGSGSKTFSSNASTSDFKIEEGTFVAPTSLTLSGDYTNNSTFTAGAGTLTVGPGQGWVVSSSTFSFSASSSINSQESVPLGIFFNPNGTKMYVIGSGDDEVNEYNLSTPWDSTTAAAFQLKSIATEEDNPTDIFFKPDGAKMYIIGQQVDEVNEYNLSTPWDVSTAVSHQLFSVTAREGTPTGLSFKPDGTKMYVLGKEIDEINEYNLSTPWDISTAVWLQLRSVTTEETGPGSLAFKPDGTKMYLVGHDEDEFNEYNLSTPWDISTAVSSGFVSIGAEESSPGGLFIKPDGTKMYTVGDVDDEVNEYNLTQQPQTLTGTLTGSSALNDVTMTGSSSKNFSSNASTTDLTITNISGTTTMPSLFSVDGDYVNNSSKPVNFSGAATYLTGTSKTISGTLTGDASLGNVTVTGSYTASNNASTSDLTINSGGSFSAPTQLSVNDDYVNNGTFTEGGGTLFFEGEKPTLSLAATTGNVGFGPSIVLDSNGYPVISHYDAITKDLIVTHCNDADCSGGDETTTTVESTGEPGFPSSIALDSNGYPVIAYYLGGTDDDLKIMHCNDVDCAGADETVTTVDSTGDVGGGLSMVLDSNGYPVVSYMEDADEIILLHCNDADCAVGGDTITTIASGVTFGSETSLKLDSNGYPVIAYNDWSNQDLKLIHCDDANCTGGETSNTVDTDYGWYASLELDASGYPVIAYYDNGSADNLKITHCNDADCAGSNETTTSVDTTGNVGEYTSLKLDSQGYPVVSYYDTTNTALKIMHCNDVDCAGSDEAITTVDSVGEVGKYSDLVLDSQGNPIVAYLDDTNDDLKILHCSDSDCDGAQTVSGTLNGTSDMGDVTLTGSSTKTFANNASTTDLTITSTAGTTTMPTLLSIAGDYSNSSIYQVEFGSGTTTFNGTSQQTATGTMTGTSAFYNLEIVNTSGSGSSSQSVIIGDTLSVDNTLTMVASTSAQFPSWATTTVANIDLNGATADSPVWLRSSTVGDDWGFDVSGTQVAVSYINVSDSNACSGNPNIDGVGGNNTDSSGNTCWDFVSLEPVISSAVNQSFYINQATTSISTITITDAETAQITAANDIRVVIASTTVDMLWNTFDTTATFGGTASGKVSGTVSYDASGSILIIDVTSDFADNDTLTISGLSFSQFDSLNAASVALGVRTDGAGDTNNNANDDKTVAITGSLTIAEHDAGQDDNSFSFQNKTDEPIYAFKMTPAGENATVTAISFDLSGVRKIDDSNLTNLKLYRDHDNDGLYDASDEQIGGAGVLNISGQTGSIDFSTDFTSTTSQNYILASDITSVKPTESITIQLLATDISATGITLSESITPNGSVTNLQHVRGGGGGSGIGGGVQGNGQVGGGGQGGGGGAGEEEDGEDIASNPNFKRPTANGGTFNQWTNPSNAYGSDATDATADSTLLRQSYGNFGFSIPGGNTIEGIAVKIDAADSGGGGTIKVALSWNGGTSSTTLKSTATLSTGDVVYTLGGSSNEWGRSWSPSELDDGNFEVIIESDVSTQNSVDGIEVRVYHQAGGGGSGGGGAI